jgi:hypothetical protein
MVTETLRIAASRHGGFWTRDDWKTLDFLIEEDWQTAIDIFEDRIRSRFLDVVESFQSMQFSGFAVIAIDCLLIETLQQFYEGKAGTPRGKVEQYFVNFLTQTSFAEFFDDDKAKKFYLQIRNGVLHQAEVKRSSRIWVRKGEPLIQYAADGNGLFIHRKKFHKQMAHEFRDYVSRLRMTNPINADLRQKFKTKMDAICA